MELNQLKELIASAGVVGAGGAGFPTAVKVAVGADSLVINASECEPLLYTDYMLMQTHMQRILDGAEAVMAAANIPNGYLGIKAHNVKRLGLTDGQQMSAHVRVAQLPDAYPVGDEVILVYQVLHRVIKPGALPLTVGALVMNAETLYNVDRALKDHVPVTEKWVTISGRVAHPVVTRVPIGMNVGELLKKMGVTVPADTVVLDGGPAMGAVIDPATAIIKKTTKGITLYPNDIPAVTGKFTENHVVNIHATSNCCQCTRCTDLCPRALLGYPLQPHKIVRTSLSVVAEMPQLFTEATACCGCGVCELVACCQNISPRRVYAQVKAILAKNKLRYSGTAEPEVDPDREYRIVPSTRFQQLIGVLPLDKMPTLRDELQSTASVTLPTRQHVGAPATPCVRNGDTVHTGDVIATANGAISANIHASIDGVVTAVSDSAITIARAQ